MNLERLKVKMYEMKITQQALSNHLEINRSTLFQRFKSGGMEFTVKEILKMRTLLRLSNVEVVDIFLK